MYRYIASIKLKWTEVKKLPLPRNEKKVHTLGDISSYSVRSSMSFITNINLKLYFFLKCLCMSKMPFATERRAICISEGKRIVLYSADILSCV